MQDYLFVCGTLTSDYVGGEIAQVMERLGMVGLGLVRGKLYNLGEYPGAVPDSSSSKLIYGELYQLRDDENTLAALDKYEGFDPTKPDECLFVRERTIVKLPGGPDVEAWIYAYKGDPKKAPIIKSGVWSK